MYVVKVGLMILTERANAQSLSIQTRASGRTNMGGKRMWAHGISNKKHQYSPKTWEGNKTAQIWGAKQDRHDCGYYQSENIIQSVRRTFVFCRLIAFNDIYIMCFKLNFLIWLPDPNCWRDQPMMGKHQANEGELCGVCECENHRNQVIRPKLQFWINMAHMYGRVYNPE